MSFKSPSRFLISTLITMIVMVGLAVRGWLWGIPQWDTAFDGALVPWIGAYGGWLLSMGIVTVGVILIGSCLVASWIGSTYHYLVLAAGAVAILTFLILGLPEWMLVQIKDEARLVIVILCVLFVLAIFYSALKARLTRRFRS